MASKIGCSVMTGGTSGLGLIAARIIAKRSNLLIVGMRGAGPALVGEALPLQLASLESVGDFCRQVLDRCSGSGIDLLVLNAGGNFALEKTEDGFESNFAVNHLAHYLIIRKLWSALTPGARIVLTTSGIHDPEEGAAVPAPKHADAHRLAYPETDPGRDENVSTAAGRSYAAAKLCNLLTAQALSRDPSVRAKHIRVLAYSPGPTPGTGLLGGRGRVIGLAFKYVLPLVARFSPALHTPKLAGSTLAEVALGEIEPPVDQVYVLLKKGKVTFPAPSVLARDEVAIARMWSDSAKMLGLHEEIEQA
ncbi:SDR family NAD(P)-dependent oxidoreductase [Billgrantia endophytica]|uniref:Dehydrogenase n=1 Tax=Billgrantia endophytica TaxID=2033802 RepID=A0A2N7U0N9_9GAMM|nr:SDR family NAD(P)-dependent oxidoreductase [Halomonas endophytica]PMR74005.1 dehydrogenase [Halomonas endophytica]